MRVMYQSKVDERGSVMLKCRLQQNLRVARSRSRIGVSKQANAGLQKYEKRRWRRRHGSTVTIAASSSFNLPSLFCMHKLSTEKMIEWPI
jgi:hypothetical protein